MGNEDGCTGCMGRGRLVLLLTRGELKLRGGRLGGKKISGSVIQLRLCRGPKGAAGWLGRLRSKGG